MYPLYSIYPHFDYTQSTDAAAAGAVVTSLINYHQWFINLVLLMNKVPCRLLAPEQDHRGRFLLIQLVRFVV